MFPHQFEAIIGNGAIRVPDEYLEAKVRKVRVLLLPNIPHGVDKARLFPDLKLSTQGTRFDREEANERYCLAHGCHDGQGA
jgi:hypothetical protein